MARIDYDDRTAAAYKAVREIPRAGLTDWRAAVARHLTPGMTVADIGAGTGTFATAFADWFGVRIAAVEPSASMRAQIPARQDISVHAGDATALPLPDASADGAWLSLVIHHIADLPAAAREIRRVLRPGAPVLLRQGYPERIETERTFPWEFFPEATEAVRATYPTLAQVYKAFAAVGFHPESLEPVPETLMSPADLLTSATAFRHADTNIRNLTEDQYHHGLEKLRLAAHDEEPRQSWLDLLVLR